MFLAERINLLNTPSTVILRAFNEMSMKIRLLVPVMCFLLFGCDKVFREYPKSAFANLIWDQDDPVTFYPEIGDTARLYDLAVGIRHAYGFSMKNVPVLVTVTSPSGKITRNRYSVNIKDEKGNYIGRCAGDICDVETVVAEDQRFTEKGKYTVVINHSLVIPRVTGIMEVGLIID